MKYIKKVNIKRRRERGVHKKGTKNRAWPHYIQFMSKHRSLLNQIGSKLFTKYCSLRTRDDKYFCLKARLFIGRRKNKSHK